MNSSTLMMLMMFAPNILGGLFGNQATTGNQLQSSGSNMLLPLMLMGGKDMGGMSGLLPIMLLSNGGLQSSDPMTQMMTINAVSKTGKRSYRRRRGNRMAYKLAYLSGAVSVLKARA